YRPAQTAADDPARAGRDVRRLAQPPRLPKGGPALAGGPRGAVSRPVLQSIRRAALGDTTPAPSAFARGAVGVKEDAVSGRVRGCLGRLFLVLAAGVLAPRGAPAQQMAATPSAGEGAGGGGGDEGPSVSSSTVGYIDPAIPMNVVRFRYD